MCSMVKEVRSWSMICTFTVCGVRYVSESIELLSLSIFKYDLACIVGSGT